jgi:hypothetical protein
MSEPRVQRTLVKSPPELWAEISDVGTLARHLGAFGEIRITRLENETTVVWEGDRACGTVELEASGWGTKVTITAAAVEAPQQEEPEPEPAAVVAEPEVEAVVEPEPEPEPDAFAQVTASLVALEIGTEPAPAPKRSLFARLFRRRAVEPEPVAVVVEVEPVIEPELIVEPEPEPVAVAEPEAEPDLAVEAILVGVLDDLGSAHHRPFSRG